MDLLAPPGVVRQKPADAGIRRPFLFPLEVLVMRKQLLVLGLVSLGLLGGVAGCSGEAGQDGKSGKSGASGDDGKDGTSGKDGTDGTGGAGGEASAGIVLPGTVLLDREEDVVVTVSNAKADDATTVDFGAGVTVDKITVTSPTTVIAHVQISANAKIGAHDVVIKAGGQDLTAKGALQVQPPLDLRVVAGDAKQGGVFAVDVKNRDTKLAFDPANFTLYGEGVFVLGSQNVTASGGTFILLVEPAAAAGAMSIIGANSDTQTYLADPSAIQVKANAPVALSGELTNQNFAQPLESRLYSVTVPAGQNALSALNIKVAADSTFSPLMIVMPPSGKVSEMLDLVSPPASFFGAEPPPYDLHSSIPVTDDATARTFTVLLVDQNSGGGAGFNFDLSHANVDAAAVVEMAGAHKTSAAAQVLTIPANKAALVKASFGATDGFDVYKLPAVTAGDNFEFSFAPDFDGEIGITDSTLSFDDNKVTAIITPSNKVVTQTVAFDKAGTFYMVVRAREDAQTLTGAYKLAARKL